MHPFICTYHYFDVSLYLVKEVDDLGQNVKASSWVDGSLVEDTRLSTISWTL